MVKINNAKRGQFIVVAFWREHRIGTVVAVVDTIDEAQHAIGRALRKYGDVCSPKVVQVG